MSTILSRASAILLAIISLCVAQAASADLQCDYRKGVLPGTCRSCDVSGQSFYKNNDGSCGACTGTCTPFLTTNPELRKLSEQSGSDRPHCMPGRADTAETLFYNVRPNREFLSEIAAISPSAASVLLNFRAEGDIAPPVDMRYGDVSFEFVPNRASVDAKFDENWDRVNALQTKAAEGEYLSVAYVSEPNADGSYLLRLSSAWKNDRGTVRQAFPTVEVILVPTSETPKLLEIMPDRRSTTLAIHSFRTLSGS